MWSWENGRGTLLFAMATSVASGLPLYLFSVLFLEITRSTSAPMSALGAIVATYWVAAFALSPAAGKISHLLGSQNLAILSVALAAASLLGSTLGIANWYLFLLWSAMGGASNALGHPASNHLIITRVQIRRLALAFGLKQAAVPLTTLLAGFAVPLVALTLGWRFAFGLSAAFTVVLIGVLTVCRGESDYKTRRSTYRRRLEPVDRNRFLVLALSCFFGAGTATVTVAFAVTASIHRGFSPGAAGALLGIASLGGALVRINAGFFADRGAFDSLKMIAAMQAVGAVGIFLMTGEIPWLFSVGLIVALGFGWGWPGLLHFVVSNTAKPATAAATGIVSVGNYAGNAVTPLVLGFIYTPQADRLFWVLVGLLLTCASVTTLLLSRRSRRGTL